MQLGCCSAGAGTACEVGPSRAVSESEQCAAESGITRGAIVLCEMSLLDVKSGSGGRREHLSSIAFLTVIACLSPLYLFARIGSRDRAVIAFLTVITCLMPLVIFCEN